MRAADLRLDTLLDYAPDGGVIRFAGQRALIFDSVALGLLRQQLIEMLGPTAARGVLTRFGHAHGVRTAQTLREALPWDDEQEWRSAGGRLHRLQGLVRFEPVDHAGEPDPPFADAIWHDSYEAEQHLLHFGQSDDVVCWTLTGFASGYLTEAHGRPIYCIETRCRGRGDAVCRMVGRPRDAWGDALEPHLHFYEGACLGEMLNTVRAALQEAEEGLRRHRRAAEPDETDGLVARSAAMRRVLDVARRVAPVDATVLVTGESGVGKERVARFVHDHSRRTAGPFVAINCGALPETLLESELFGHARGAFSGATADRPGLFEAAQSGTLFLDEVGEVSAAMQVKLLRVLQEREVRRVGENRTRPVDVRIVAATNRDLAAEVAAGRFREDLYYRLKVVEIRIPPLRARPEDILPLARRMLAESAARLDRKINGLTPAANEALLRHHWPGNVRELQNAMERAAALTCSRQVDRGDLPEDVGAARTPAPAAAAPVAAADGATLADVERAHILTTLEHAGGNKAEAARRLGIGTATLFRKLREYRDSASS